MKNLANYKIPVRSREYLIQAIFQMLFDNQIADNIIAQFKEEHKTKKVDFDLFSKSLLSIEKNIKKIESAINSLKIKNSSLELIDKSILYFSIIVMLFCEFVKPVVIDESLRLSKKFSSPDSYKFINVSLDKFLKTLK